MKYNYQLLNSTWGIAIWKGPIANLSFLHFLKTNVQPIHILVSASFDGCAYHDTKTIQNKQWYPGIPTAAILPPLNQFCTDLFTSP